MLFTHTFQPRVIDGYAYGLNYGLVGMGSNNSRGSFDNVAVQVLPPQITLEATEDFEDEANPTLSFDAVAGIWDFAGGNNKGHYTADPNGGAAISLIDLEAGQLAINSYLELEGRGECDRSRRLHIRPLRRQLQVRRDRLAVNNELVIGHYTTNKGWVDDAVASRVIDAGQDYTLGVMLKGSTVSVTLDGQVLLGHIFNAVTVDGNFGLIATEGAASFDDVLLKTDDPFYRDPSDQLVAAQPASDDGAYGVVVPADLAPIVDEAIRRLAMSMPLSAEQRAALAGVDVSIDDLPGLTLAHTERMVRASFWISMPPATAGSSTARQATTGSSASIRLRSGYSLRRTAMPTAAWIC